MNARGRHLVVRRIVLTLMAVTAVDATVASGLIPPTDRNVMVRIIYCKIINVYYVMQFYD